MMEMVKQFDGPSIDLKGCRLHSVRSNLLKGEVAITFHVNLQTTLDVRPKLLLLAADEQPLDLQLRPYQFTLPLKAKEGQENAP